MRNRIALCLTAVGTSFCLAPPANAQDEAASSAQDGEFSVQRFLPAAGSNNYLAVEGARFRSQLGWTAGLFFNYSREPFSVVSCVSATDCDAPNATNTESIQVISDMMTWDLLGSFNPADFVQIGLRVPLSFVTGQGIDLERGTPGPGVTGFGIGDPNLEGKLRFFGEPDSVVVLGGALDLQFPLGHATAEGKFIGNDSPIAVGFRGIADFKPLEELGISANLRGVYRGESTLASTTVGPLEFHYGVGVGYQISPVFGVLAESTGTTQFSTQNGTNTMEIDGGVRISPLSTGLAFTLGGGVGVLEGVGVPVARGIFGVMFVNEAGDQDGDGIADAADQCPTKPEDKDGFEDEDGCPDPDNDKDSVEDAKDKCPDKPETINGFEDEDGCPDSVKDSDADGIPDDKDKCPQQAGKMRLPEFYGCPDTDEDGVADPVDKCPNEKEDTDGFQDTDGCPDPDNDQDGVLDEADECSDDPETKNGFEDEDGCPDTVPAGPSKPKLVEVGATEIKILQRVEFTTGSDKIQGAQSFAVLDAVADVLKQRKSIQLVEIAGHTDNAGNAAQNKALSQKRADAVKTYLVGKGVEAERLKPVGYGPEKPIGDNTKPDGKQQNRRVEFNIQKKPDPSASPAAAP